MSDSKAQISALSLAEQREQDRKRYSDPAFNRWLDEGISDSGHTVWDAIGDTGAAWAGWQNRPHYDAPAAPQAEPVAWAQKAALDGVRDYGEIIATLYADAEESEALRERLSELLRNTAIALRGPEPKLTRWSWHDLPELAAALKAQRDALLGGA